LKEPWLRHKTWQVAAADTRARRPPPQLCGKGLAAGGRNAERTLDEGNPVVRKSDDPFSQKIKELGAYHGAGIFLFFF